jgi:hypothetical protein
MIGLHDVERSQGPCTGHVVATSQSCFRFGVARKANSAGGKIGDERDGCRTDTADGTRLVGRIAGGSRAAPHSGIWAVGPAGPAARPGRTPPGHGRVAVVPDPRAMQPARMDRVRLDAVVRPGLAGAGGLCRDQAGGRVARAVDLLCLPAGLAEGACVRGRPRQHAGRTALDRRPHRPPDGWACRGNGPVACPPGQPKLSRKPGAGQVMRPNRPVPDRVMVAVRMSGPPKQILVG